MAYDEGLAQRIRESLADRQEVTEKKMFGGVAFMVAGTMVVGVVKEDMMVHVGPAQHDEAMAQPHARAMDFTGKPMRGFVFVGPDGYESDETLQNWVARGVAYAASAPTKKAPAKKPGKRVR